MTEQAKRAAAFCERVITYNDKYWEYRDMELQMLDDLEEEENQDEYRAKEDIRATKNYWDRLAKRARLEIMDLINAAHLPPRHRTVMIWRYNRCFTFDYIASHFRPKRITERRVFQMRKEALERMAYYMDKLYPNWDPEQEPNV